MVGGDGGGRLERHAARGLRWQRQQGQNADRGSHEAGGNHRPGHVGVAKGWLAGGWLAGGWFAEGRFAGGRLAGGGHAEGGFAGCIAEFLVIRLWRSDARVVRRLVRSAREIEVADP
ncbi:MAG TPA: hypothetical protein VH482_14045 [Thermomicrobiales bacterium]